MTLDNFSVKGVTAFFFALYFLMATQDIAVDGWALTMLSKRNRGRGPVCNSIGQNIGFFLSYVGFLALNDPDSSENIWRPMFGMTSRPGEGLVSVKGFLKFTGVAMIAVTIAVALFKREVNPDTTQEGDGATDDGEDAELDASELGVRETYRRLWKVCQLPSVRWLFLVLLTYRFPVSLSDNVKPLKAVEYGLTQQTTALLSPTIILPLGILVPIVAAKVWKNAPLRQFIDAYRFRVTVVPLLDVVMLISIRAMHGATDTRSRLTLMAALVASTAAQAAVNSMQFNAQMTFFASRVDPAIGGSYMTLLNTAANLGGTWPASVVMYLVGKVETCTGGQDAYFVLQAVFSVLGCLWLAFMSRGISWLA